MTAEISNFRLGKRQKQERSLTLKGGFGMTGKKLIERTPCAEFAHGASANANEDLSPLEGIRDDSSDGFDFHSGKTIRDSGARRTCQGSGASLNCWYFSLKTSACRSGGSFVVGGLWSFR